MASHKSLADQVMVITGASSGIGLMTALLAAERGAKLVLAARNEDTLERLVDQIAQSGGEAIAVPTDVGVRADLFDLAERAVEHFGRIDTWVNNAGVAIYGELEQVDDDDSRRLFDVNFWGVVNGSLAALPHLRNQGGALINLGSEVSEAVIPLQGMYAASKHAVKGFTDALRIEVEEVGGSQVTVSLVQPTAVDTPYPMHARNYMDQEPKLPTPMIDPHRVAETILEAAENGGRHLKVGAMAHMNTTMAKLMPGIADKLSAMQAGRQQEDMAPQSPAGTLFRAGGEGSVYGRGGAKH